MVSPRRTVSPRRPVSVAALTSTQPGGGTGKPPDVDWWTQRPETFDVAHSDGLFFVDETGHLRIVVLGMPNVHGRLAARLRRLLSGEGIRNLDHPQVAWTVPQALDDLGALLGRLIPPAP